MSFTETDLMRLKLHGWDWFYDQDTALKALLARLKAAEDCAQAYVEDWPNGGTATKWRKSKGE